ncbi:MAG TPA: hypothetical protein VGN57_15735 [Pirellulaceae bacterium]|jgi:type II secretory pathway pseudopilin PulG|nr:hypothetical protein [Pirellulaceae bacterium]
MAHKAVLQTIPGSVAKLESVRRTGARRSAFTLLEVILALALSVIILGIVVGTIQLNLIALSERRARVEDVQLAHAVLNRIAGDLESCLSRQTTDTSGLEALAAGMGDIGSLADLGGLDGGDLGGPGDEGDDGGSGDGGDDAGGDDSGGDDTGGGDDSGDGGSGSGGTGGAGFSMGEDAEQTETAAAPQGPPPGIYGTANELQVDVSRLPRLDEYQGSFNAETGSYQQPSDVKTVTYFLVEAPANAEEEVGMTPRYGLMRGEIGRAAASYAKEMGNVASDADDAESLCPEVEYLEFRYFDGMTWLSDWDTDLNKGLCRAVEVTIRMRAEVDESGAPVSAQDEVDRTYKLVVHLPLSANNAAYEDEAAAADAAAPDAVDDPADDAGGDDAGGDDTGGGGPGGGAGGGGTGGGGPGGGGGPPPLPPGVGPPGGGPPGGVPPGGGRPGGGGGGRGGGGPGGPGGGGRGR